MMHSIIYFFFLPFLFQLNKKGESKEILGKISNTPEALQYVSISIVKLELVDQAVAAR